MFFEIWIVGRYADLSYHVLLLAISQSPNMSYAKTLITWSTKNIDHRTLQIINAENTLIDELIYLSVVYMVGYLSTWVRFSHVSTLTYWGRDKMDAISQTTFSSAFSWMKMFEFRLKFHWSLFLRVQLTIIQHWFRWWLGADQVTSHYLNHWWLVFWRIYASPGLNELIQAWISIHTLNKMSWNRVSIRLHRWSLSMDN